MNQIVAELMDLITELTEGEVRPDPGYAGPDSIRRLGLNSLRTLNFLVTVEDTYGIEWDDELPEDVLASFELMAEYIATQRDVEYA